jgi:hypothetical protein
MNYGLVLSLKMEEIIRRLEIERGERASLADSSTSSDGDGGEDIEGQALRLAVEEIYEESERRFQPWAHNAKALRMGEVIVTVDSDTIVPVTGKVSVWGSLLPLPAYLQSDLINLVSRLP